MFNSIVDILSKKDAKFYNLLLVPTITLLVLSICYFEYLSFKEDSLAKQYEQSLFTIPQAIIETNENITKSLEALEQQTTVLSAYNVLKSSSKALGSPTNKEMLSYAETIVNESEKYGIDPLLILAIINTESSFRYNVVSHKGAVGLMQVLPNTAFYVSRMFRDVHLSKRSQLFNVETNLKIGIAYFSYLIKKTGSVNNAIIAYNYGTGNMRKDIINKKPLPQYYLKKVLRNYSAYSNDDRNIYERFAQND